MTDLIKRLQRGNNGQEIEAADRIEELEKERDEYKELYYHCFKDAASLNIHYAEIAYAAKTAEAKLTKAVEVLRKIANFSEADVLKYIQGVDAIALDVLAELEGK